MSKTDDKLIDIMNAGGTVCTCKGASRDDAVMYVDKNGKLLFYINKFCPIHGIGRQIKSTPQAEETVNTTAN
jgi:hypothetical protein